MQGYKNVKDTRLKGEVGATTLKYFKLERHKSDQNSNTESKGIPKKL